MSTIKQDAQAARARAIAEALQASGARSLMQQLAESERHKEHLDRLCAKLEALPKVVKKRRGSDDPAKRMVEDRKSTAKEELKWRAEFKTLGREAVRTTGSITMLVLNPQPAMACPGNNGR